MIYGAFVNSLAILLLVLLVFLLLHNLYQTYEHFRTARAFARHSPHALFIPLSVLRKQPFRRAGLPQYLTNTLLQAHEQASELSARETWQRREPRQQQQQLQQGRKDGAKSYKAAAVKGKRGVRGSLSSLSSAAALVDATRSSSYTMPEQANNNNDDDNNDDEQQPHTRTTPGAHIAASQDETIVKVDTSLLNNKGAGSGSSSTSNVCASGRLSSSMPSAQSMSSSEYYTHRSRQRRRGYGRRSAHTPSHSATRVLRPAGEVYDLALPFLGRAGVNLYENLEYDDYIHIDIWNGSLDTSRVLGRLEHNLERTANVAQTRVIGLRLPAQVVPTATPAVHLRRCVCERSRRETAELMLSSELQGTSVASAGSRGGSSSEASMSATYVIGADNMALLRHLAAGIWRTSSAMSYNPYSLTTGGCSKARAGAMLVRLLCHFTQNEELVCLRARRTQQTAATIAAAAAAPFTNTLASLVPHHMREMGLVRYDAQPRRTATQHIDEHTYAYHRHNNNSDSYVFSSPGSSLASSYVRQQQQQQQRNKSLWPLVHISHRNHTKGEEATMHKGYGAAKAVSGVLTREEREHAAEEEEQTWANHAQYNTNSTTIKATNNNKNNNDDDDNKMSLAKRAALCLGRAETRRYDLQLIESLPRTLVKVKGRGRGLCGLHRRQKGYGNVHDDEADVYCDVSTAATLSPKGKQCKAGGKRGKAAAKYMQQQQFEEEGEEEMALLPAWRRNALLVSLRDGHLSLSDLVLSVLRDRLEAYRDIFSHYSDDDDDDYDYEDHDEREYGSSSSNNSDDSSDDDENEDAGRHAQRFHTGSDDENEETEDAHVSHSAAYSNKAHRRSDDGDHDDDAVLDEREAMRGHYHEHHTNNKPHRGGHEGQARRPRHTKVKAACAYASWHDTVAAAAAIIAQLQIQQSKRHEAAAMMRCGLPRRHRGSYDYVQDYVIAFTLCGRLQPFGSEHCHKDDPQYSAGNTAHASLCSSLSDYHPHTHDNNMNGNDDATTSELCRAMSWAGIALGANVELLYGATVHDLAASLLAHRRTVQMKRTHHHLGLPGPLRSTELSRTTSETLPHETSRSSATVLSAHHNHHNYHSGGSRSARHATAPHHSRRNTLTTTTATANTLSSSSWASLPRRADSFDGDTMEQHSMRTSRTDTVSSTLRPRLVECTATGPGLLTETASPHEERLMRSAATLNLSLSAVPAFSSSSSSSRTAGAPASSSDSYPATVVATEVHSRLIGPPIVSNAHNNNNNNTNNNTAAEHTSNITSQANLGSASLTMTSSATATALSRPVSDAGRASASASTTQFAPLQMESCLSTHRHTHAGSNSGDEKEGKTGGEAHKARAVSDVAQGSTSHPAIATAASVLTHKLSSTVAHPATQAIAEEEHKEEGAHSPVRYTSHTPAVPLARGEDEEEEEEEGEGDILDALRDSTQAEGGLALPTPLRYLRIGTELYVVHAVIDKTFVQYRERRTVLTPPSSRATSLCGEDAGRAQGTRAQHTYDSRTNTPQGWGRTDAAGEAKAGQACGVSGLTASAGLSRRHDRKSAAALRRAERERRWAATRQFAEVGYSLSAGLQPEYTTTTTTTTTTTAANNNYDTSKVNNAASSFAGRAGASLRAQAGSGVVREEVRMCWRCLSVEATVINLPCGHFATCAPCAALSTTCCVCGTTIDSTITLH